MHNIRSAFAETLQWKKQGAFVLHTYNVSFSVEKAKDEGAGAVQAAAPGGVGSWELSTPATSLG